MAATTTFRDTPFRAIFGVALAALSFGVKAAEPIIKGTIVALDAQGRLVNGITGVGLRVPGIALEDVTGSAVDGEERAQVQPGCAHVGNDGSIAADDVGKVCYLVDNQTVALTDGGGTRSRAGVIADVDADGVWVSFLDFLLAPS